MTDVRRQGLSAGSRVRVVTAQVTMLAKALEARHLAGPAAGAVLAEGLAAAALLAVDLGRADETIYIRLKVTGPVDGVLVEASGAGDLRGFTHRKVIDALDAAETMAPADALGDAGSAQIVHSLPGRVLNQSVMEVRPPRFETLLARWFLQSLQVPSAVAVVAESDAGGVRLARALLAQRMPDTDPAVFARVLEAFADGRAAACLRESADLEALRDVLALPDLAPREPQPLQFRCRCSRERSEAALGALPLDELDAMLAENKNHSVTCHMCGEDYAITPDTLRRLRAARAALEDPEERNDSV